jgi:hypothetical protein
MESKPQLYDVIFINLYLKDEVVDKVMKHPMTHKQDRKHQSMTQANDSRHNSG